MREPRRSRFRRGSKLPADFMNWARDAIAAMEIEAVWPVLLNRTSTRTTLAVDSAAFDDVMECRITAVDPGATGKYSWVEVHEEAAGGATDGLRQGAYDNDPAVERNRYNDLSPGYRFFGRRDPRSKVLLFSGDHCPEVP